MLGKIERLPRFFIFFEKKFKTKKGYFLFDFTKKKYIFVKIYKNGI